MKLSEWLAELSVLACRVERLRGRPLVVRRSLGRVLLAAQALIEDCERSQGINWYQPDTWPERKRSDEGLN